MRKNAPTSADASPAPPIVAQPTGSALEEVLKTKTPEQIMHPEMIEITYKMTDRDGQKHEFVILPMVEDALIVVSESLDRLLGLFMGLGDDKGLPSFSDPAFGKAVTDNILPNLGKVVQVLLPNSTRLIAATLEMDMDWVKANFTLPMRLEMIGKIVEAEDIPALIKAAGDSVATFQKVSRQSNPTATTTTD